MSVSAVGTEQGAFLDGHLKEAFSDPLFVRIWTPGANPAKLAPSGALRANEIRAKVHGKWHVETQAVGFRLLLRAFQNCDEDTAERAWDALEWPFDHQTIEGAVGAKFDQFHSATLFAAALADSLILDEVEALHSIDDEVELVSDFRHLARWLARPDVMSFGMEKNRPFAHRKWMLAYVLMVSGAESGDDPLLRTAKSLALQARSDLLSDGTAVERDGFDVNYQSLSIFYAAKIQMAGLLGENLTPSIAKMSDRLLRAVKDDGGVDHSDSTRVWKEHGRSGGLKDNPYREMATALIFAHHTNQDNRYREKARLIVKRNLPKLWETIDAAAPIAKCSLDWKNFQSRSVIGR
jgi:hypothetical protein